MYFVDKFDALLMIFDQHEFIPILETHDDLAIGSILYYFGMLEVGEKDLLVLILLQP